MKYQSPVFVLITNKGLCAAELNQLTYTTNFQYLIDIFYRKNIAHSN